MKAMIYWFSGTGNSWLVAARIAEALEAKGIPSVLSPVEAYRTPKLRLAASRALDADAHGAGLPVEADGLDVFCFPVFSFAAPALVDRFMARLPVALGRKAALVVTMGGGGYEGRALKRATRRLRESGRKTVLAAALEMPEAFVQFYGATEPAAAEARTQAALAEADRLAGLLAEGREEIRPAKASGFAATWIASAAFSSLGRRILGLCWSASASCTGCGLCAASCPKQSIVMIGKRPVWKASCEDCQRCANLCPTGAIRLSVPALLAFVVPVFLPWARWFGPLLGASGGGERFLVWLAGVVLGSVAMAYVVRLLELIPGVRRLMSASWAASFRRRLAPGFAEELAARRRGR
jgi:ferredoxin